MRLWRATKIIFANPSFSVRFGFGVLRVCVFSIFLFSQTADVPETRTITAAVVEAACIVVVVAAVAVALAVEGTNR